MGESVHCSKVYGRRLYLVLCFENYIQDLNLIKGYLFLNYLLILPGIVVFRKLQNDAPTLPHLSYIFPTVPLINVSEILQHPHQVQE